MTGANNRFSASLMGLVDYVLIYVSFKNSIYKENDLMHVDGVVTVHSRCLKLHAANQAEANG